MAKLLRTYEACVIARSLTSTVAAPTVALTRLSSTSMRATIANAGGSDTITLSYQTGAESAWSTTTRSGNGTIDLTNLTKHATYYAVVQRDSGSQLSAVSPLAYVALRATDARLSEEANERQRTHVETPLYTGWAYRRVFNCPKGDVSAALANELAFGSLLPEKWGGVATANPEDPRLQSAVVQQQPGGSMDKILCTFVSIDTL